MLVGGKGGSSVSIAAMVGEEGVAPQPYQAHHHQHQHHEQKIVIRKSWSSCVELNSTILFSLFFLSCGFPFFSDQSNARYTTTTVCSSQQFTLLSFLSFCCLRGGGGGIKENFEQ